MEIPLPPLPSSSSSSLLDTDLSVKHLSTVLQQLSLHIADERSLQTDRIHLTVTTTIQTERDELIRRLQSLEREQASLAAQDLFEEADGLSLDIDEIRNDLQRLGEQRKRRKEQWKTRNKQIHFDRNKLLKDVDIAACEVRDGQILSMLRDEANRLQKIANDKDVLMTSRLAMETKRLAKEKQRSDREKESLDLETLEVKEAIACQCGDLEDLRDVKMSSLSVVQKQIQDLEEQLLLRRKEEEMIVNEMKQLETQVTEVKKKFDRQIQRLKDRRHVCETSLLEWQQEMLIVEEQEQKRQEELQQQKKRTEELLIQSKQLEMTTDIVHQCVHCILQQQPIQHDDEEDDEEDDDDECLSLESHHQECLNKSLLLIQEKQDLTCRLNSLEIDKRSHAVAKRFREAAGTAKELKDVNIRLEQLETELLEVSEQEKMMKEKLCLLRNERMKRKDEIRNMRKQKDLFRLEDLKTFKRIANKCIRKVQNQMSLQKIPITSESECSSVLDLLLLQIEMSKEQISIIEKRHGLVVVTNNENDENDDENENDEEQDDKEQQDEQEKEDDKEQDEKEQEKEQDEKEEIIINSQILQQTKVLLRELISIEKLLEDCSIREEFEEAADLQEKVTEMTITLEDMLKRLGRDRQSIEEEIHS